MTNSSRLHPATNLLRTLTLVVVVAITAGCTDEKAKAPDAGSAIDAPLLPDASSPIDAPLRSDTDATLDAPLPPDADAPIDAPLRSDADAAIDMGPLCQGQPLPPNADRVPYCFPGMFVCTTCAGRNVPGCSGVCFSSRCWDCGGNGWVLSPVDCPMNCPTVRADAGTDL